jgi:hypothetical protein
MTKELEGRLADARTRAHRTSGADIHARLAAAEEVRRAERDRARARCETYAEIIDIGPRWDTGAPLPHLISNGSRAFILCRASQPDPDWDGSYVRMVSAADEQPAAFVVIELRGCLDIRLGAPSNEAIRGHPLYGKGLSPYQAHEVANSEWVGQHIKINSAHPQHSDTPFRRLRHYLLLFHDEMAEALADGIQSRLTQGTMRQIMTGLATDLIDRPFRG